MDHARLARDTVEKLAPYLKELMEKQVPHSDASQSQMEAFRLWKLIHPRIALRFGVIRAINNTIDDNSAVNRAALAQELTQVFRINEHIASQVMEILQSQPGEKKDEKAPPSSPSLDYFSPVSTSGKEFSAEQIACQECGAKDETLRLVSYPFVLSLIIMTFRRVFQGVYCARHANRFYFLALLLTITIGWIGIPFGLLFTPLTIFSLLTVDKKLRPANAKLLLEIAKTRIEAGEMETAAVYLKESLWLEDSEPTRTEAQKVTDLLKPMPQPKPFSQVTTWVFHFLTVWVMGILVGLIDGVIGLPLAEIKGNLAFLAIIFSYLPLILLLLYGSYVAARLSAEAAQKAALRSKNGGYLLAIVISLGVVYAILTGKTLFSGLMDPHPEVQTLWQAISYYAGLIFNGGWQQILNVLTNQDLASLMFVAQVFLGGVLFLWNILDHITQTTNWLVALDEITATPAQESGIRAVLISVFLLVIFWLIFSAVFFSAG